MADAGLRCDRFLNGRVAAWQPVAGFRSATDAVFLAAAVPALPGERVLELGCGAGVAALCLLARVPGVSVTGVEVQPSYADLARRNGAAAGLRVVEGDVAALPADLRAERFDHVMTNPPWFEAAAPAAADPGRDAAQRVATPLALWLDVALRRLAPGGWLSVIHRAERLAELLAPLAGRAGSARVLPLQSRPGRDAGRVIVQARKGAKGPLRLLAPFVIHEGAAHGEDGDDFTAPARKILRDGGPLTLSGASSDGNLAQP